MCSIVWVTSRTNGSDRCGNRGDIFTIATPCLTEHQARGDGQGRDELVMLVDGIGDLRHVYFGSNYSIY